MASFFVVLLKMKTIYIEALIVGFITLAVGYPIVYITHAMFGKNDPSWNKYHIVEVSLVMTGFVAHILLEYSGMNMWYCTRKIGGATLS